QRYRAGRDGSRFRSQRNMHRFSTRLKRLSEPHWSKHTNTLAMPLRQFCCAGYAQMVASYQRRLEIVRGVPPSTEPAMNAYRGVSLLCFIAVLVVPVLAAEPAPPSQELNTWVKRSPLKDGPPSPGLSYETSLAYDPIARRVLRWGGHAQGGVKGS